MVTRIAAGHVQVGWVIVAVVVVFLVLVVVGQVRRIQTTYSITNQRLTIQTGILSRDLHQTRLERIQNVNSSQSLFERLLRVGTVDVRHRRRVAVRLLLPGRGRPARHRAHRRPGAA